MHGQGFLVWFAGADARHVIFVLASTGPLNLVVRSPAGHPGSHGPSLC